MKIKTSLLLVISFFLVQSCGNSSNDSGNDGGSDFNKMAAEICECMRPLKELTDNIKILSAEGKTEEIQEITKQFQPIMDAANDCAAALDEKYEIGDGEEDKAFAALKSACPDIAELMEGF